MTDGDQQWARLKKNFHAATGLSGDERRAGNAAEGARETVKSGWRAAHGDD
ncbi:MAG: hypothetical protein WD078_01645 [Woeseia sp.]